MYRAYLRVRIRGEESIELMLALDRVRFGPALAMPRLPEACKNSKRSILT